MIEVTNDEYEFFNSFINTLMYHTDDILNVKFLDRFVPEIRMMSGLAQGVKFHPEGDVLTHTIYAVKAINNLISQNIIKQEDAITCVLCAVFHDIGKIETQGLRIQRFENEEQSHVTFHNHENVGVDIFQRISKRNYYLRIYSAPVEFCIKNHMKMHKIYSLKRSKREYILNHEYSDYLKFTHIADINAREDPDSNVNPGVFSTKMYMSHKTIFDSLQLFSGYISKIKIESFSPVLSGKELIAMGFEEGPLIGTILKDIKNIKYKFIAYLYVFYKYKILKRKNNG